MYEVDQAILHQARERIAQERKWNVTLLLQPPTGISLQGSRATVSLTRHAFRFGCNAFLLHTPVDSELLVKYGERFADLLNYATLPFYWGSFEPEPDNTQEDRLRMMAIWCQEHQIATKGHPLAWHQVFPQWAQAMPDAEVVRRQRRRIPQLVSAFQGLVDIWDVVNEATVSYRFDNAIGRWIAANPAEVVGEFIRSAHAAAPKAELLYNDYNVRAPECDQLIADMLAANVPMTAIGIQSHMHVATWSLQEAWAICERYARFGLPLHFTELTILSGRPKDPQDRDWHRVHTDWFSTPEGEEQQLLYGEAFYTLLYSHPAVEAITWWDFTDYHAWQGAPAGLVRADMSPKPLYNRLMELVWGDWATHAETILAEGADMVARCTAGEHRVEVSLPSGTVLHGTFTVDKGEQGPISVPLS